MNSTSFLLFFKMNSQRIQDALAHAVRLTKFDNFSCMCLAQIDLLGLRCVNCIIQIFLIVCITFSCNLFRNIFLSARYYIVNETPIR